MTSRVQTLETEMLAEEENFAGLARINRELAGRVEALDSRNTDGVGHGLRLKSWFTGRTENSAHNGRFESTCYHPLLLFNREGECLASWLRPGNVHSAQGWEELRYREIERQQNAGKEVVFGVNATFAKPEIYEALEGQSVRYAIRIPSNECVRRPEQAVRVYWPGIGRAFSKTPASV